MKTHPQSVERLLARSFLLTASIVLAGCGPGLGYHHATKHSDLSINVLRAGELPETDLFRSDVHPGEVLMAVSNTGSSVENLFLGGTFYGSIALSDTPLTGPRDVPTPFVCRGALYQYSGTSGCNHWQQRLDELLAETRPLRLQALLPSVDGGVLLHLADEVGSNDLVARLSPSGFVVWKKALNLRAHAVVASSSSWFVAAAKATSLHLARYDLAAGTPVWTRDYTATARAGVVPEARLASNSAGDLLLVAIGYERIRFGLVDSNAEPQDSHFTGVTVDGDLRWTRLRKTTRLDALAIAADRKAFVLGDGLIALDDDGAFLWNVFRLFDGGQLLLDSRGRPAVVRGESGYPAAISPTVSVSRFDGDGGEFWGPTVEGGLTSSQSATFVFDDDDLVIATYRPY